MREFWKWYRWGLNTKLYMGIYFAAYLFWLCLIQAFFGVWSVPTVTLLEMLLTAFAVAVIQRLAFPREEGGAPGSLALRTGIWLSLSLGLVVGVAAWRGWFAAPLPGWAIWTFAAAMLAGYGAMWVGLHIAARIETTALNDGLDRLRNR